MPSRQHLCNSQVSNTACLYPAIMEEPATQWFSSSRWTCALLLNLVCACIAFALLCVLLEGCPEMLARTGDQFAAHGNWVRCRFCRHRSPGGACCGFTEIQLFAADHQVSGSSCQDHIAATASSSHATTQTTMCCSIDHVLLSACLAGVSNA